jgi:putative DNA primase/helicase
MVSEPATDGNCGPRDVASFDYRDAPGNVVYQVRRFEPGFDGAKKSFAQFTPDGNRRWKKGLNGTAPTLYRLPELLAAPSDQPVFIVEGERKVDELCAMGLLATCSPMGAGKWKDTYSQYLKDRHVIILPDNDKPGHVHAKKVQLALRGIAASCSIVVLPGLEDKGDIIDWLRIDGNNKKRLLELCMDEARKTDEQAKSDVSARPVAASARCERVAAPQDGDAHHLTDLGNARRVKIRHGIDLRFIHPWKAWLVWDGRRWAEDTTAEAVRRVKDTQGALYDWVADRLKELRNAGDDSMAAQKDRLVKLLNHAIKWEDARAIGRSLELLKSEPDVPVLPYNLDLDQFLLNVLNGTLDLRTGQLRQHMREDLITKLAPVFYDPSATCLLWLKFLDRIMDGNRDLINYRQRVVGYGLTGDVSEQCLWFFYGTGANGKSTFLATLLAMHGDYGMQAVSELLMVKNHKSHPTERADLFGKRFVATIETEEGKRMAEALMKQMTGGDKVRARKMRQDFFEFAPTHKIILAANHKPSVRGTDHAAWRRIKLVPFAVTITDEEKDKALPEKLKTELSGVLAWAVRGCLDWQRNGLAEPEDVHQATDAYHSEQDSVQGFIGECCVVRPEVRVRASALLEAYHGWSGDRLMSLQAFGQRLREKGFVSKRGHGGGYFWHGIGLSQNGAGEHGEQDADTC